MLKRWVVFQCLLAAASVSSAQVRVFVSYEDELKPVVAMRGAAAIVELDGERVIVPEGNVEVEVADRFTDGAIEVIAREAMMGQDYGSPYGGFFFRFDATVEAERDFEDCFVLFAISPETGEPTYVMREVGDIHSPGQDRVLVTLPVNPGFGGGTFGYKLFSKGEEIRLYEPDEPLAVRNMRGGMEGEEASARSSRHSADRGSGQGEPAKAVKARLLEFPESLVGKVGGGYATAIYTVDEKGRAYEFLDVAADNKAFIPEVWKTVVQTRYEPGRFNGKPLVTTVQQSFFFNEFAPFSEEMVMIPYPTIGDRSATAAYAPLPQANVKRSVEIKVEVDVGLLGQVRSITALNDADTDAGRAAVDAVKDWIFVPAVQDGFAVEQTVVVPIQFSQK